MKLIIIVKKFTVPTRVYEGKVTSLEPIPLDEYTEERDISLIKDKAVAKQKFIEDIAKQVFRHNKNEEERVLEHQTSTMTKLIIHSIT